MAKLTVKELSEDVPPTQRKQPPGKFALQVDRQTKASFETSEEAEKAGQAIKNSYPVVHVVVYDTVVHTRKVIEAN